jgi:hypothetical protein
MMSRTRGGRKRLKFIAVMPHLATKTCGVVGMGIGTGMALWGFAMRKWKES